MHIGQALSELFNEIRRDAESPVVPAPPATRFESKHRALYGADAPTRVALALRLAIDAVFECEDAVVVIAPWSLQESALGLIATEALVPAPRIRSRQLRADDWPHLARAAGLLDERRLLVASEPDGIRAIEESLCGQMSSTHVFVLTQRADFLASTRLVSNAAFITYATPPENLEDLESWPVHLVCGGAGGIQLVRLMVPQAQAKRQSMFVVDERCEFAFPIARAEERPFRVSTYAWSRLIGCTEAAVREATGRLGLGAFPELFSGDRLHAAGAALVHAELFSRRVLVDAPRAWTDAFRPPSGMVLEAPRGWKRAIELEQELGVYRSEIGKAANELDLKGDPALVVQVWDPEKPQPAFVYSPAAVARLAEYFGYGTP